MVDNHEWSMMLMEIFFLGKKAKVFLNLKKLLLVVADDDNVSGDV